MEKLILFSVLVYLYKEAHTLNLPGPLVYVVTPSPRTPQSEARSAPFYYQNWIRRMDPPKNATTTTPTPDLIFAEFQSGNRMKSIRKLLEKEKIEPKTTTTASPIYVPDANTNSDDENYKLPLAPPVNIMKVTEKTTTPDMTDYFALYNNMYNVDSAPVYMPSTTSRPVTPPSTTRITTTTTSAPESNVQNIWHIIDSQKDEDYAGNWEVVANDEKDESDEQSKGNKNKGGAMDGNFALPGFGTNPGHGAENESRAIHTEPNMRFPYINLKPFQMKNQKKPNLNSISNSKKGNDLYTNLDNFHELQHPIRGEANDVVPTTRQPIDRYNPAQPYLPPPEYAVKSKQSSPSIPSKAVANLVPPPPPPPPKVSDNDFPAPPNYESFPPFAPSGPPAASRPKPSTSFQPPDSDESDDDLPGLAGYEPFPPYAPSAPAAPPALNPPTYTPEDSDAPDDDDLPTDYQPPLYKPPPPPQPYNKPVDLPADDDTPDFDGYHYNKPVYSPPSPPPPPPPPPSTYGKDFYAKPVYAPPQDTYGKDYHIKPVYGAPYGYTYPTTTTTTETPRVNRYSYYYLGKKLYYLPLYFSVYFIVYVGALIIKAVLRHKIVYPNSWRPNDQTSSFFSKRSIDSYDTSNENLHEITGRVTHAIAVAGEKYFSQKKKK